MQDQKKSPYFGLCKGANVILITLESVSAAYLKPYYDKGLEASYLNEISAKGWSSKYHICLSPNTNTSLAMLYTGRYFNKSTNPSNYINLAAHNNYNFSYLSTANDLAILKKLGVNNFACADSRINNKNSDAENFNRLCHTLTGENRF